MIFYEPKLFAWQKDLLSFWRIVRNIFGARWLWLKNKNGSLRNFRISIQSQMFSDHSWVRFFKLLTISFKNKNWLIWYLSVLMEFRSEKKLEKFKILSHVILSVEIHSESFLCILPKNNFCQMNNYFSNKVK